MNRRIALFLIVLVSVLFIPLQPSVSYAKTYSGYADTITYTTDEEEDFEFVEDDFDEACYDLTDEDLDYVKFTLPSSSKGTLYYNFTTKSSSNKVSESTKYYMDKANYLSKVTFLPADDYEGIVTIYYTGYNDDGDSYDGKIKITVGDDDDNNNEDADDMEYEIDSDETLDFDEDDFNEICDDLTDEKLDYVKFTLPSSSCGTLYYKYISKDNYTSKASASTKYYYDESPSISDITFVPDEDYEGTVVIKYTARNVDREDYDGKVKISVNEGKGSSKVIEYAVDTGKTIEFIGKDFNNMSQDLNDEKLDYVNFTLPSSSKGILYYDYDDGEYDSKVSASKDYYYKDDPDISKISFVPNANFKGVCKIEFKGYDKDKGSFTGTVEITVGKGSLLTADPVNYTVKPGSSVYFKDDDFNSVCKKLMKNTLDYVKFTLPPASAGKLYYGYNSSGANSAEVSPSSKYYYGATPFILNIAYVPASNASGTTSIDYTGYDSEGSSYKGKVQITVSGTGATPATPTTTGLKKSTYFKDVNEAYSWAVDYIDKLYQDGVVTGSTGTDGAKHFYPETKITRGEFMLLLFKALNFQTNTSAGCFSDVAKSDYYYDAIATAKYLGIALGSDNKFNPKSSITREDAMVLTMRAMSKSGKSIAAGDVSSLTAYSDNYLIDAYAKDAVAALIKAGIITGSDDNKIHPMESISRIQSAAIIYRIKY